MKTLWRTTCRKLVPLTLLAVGQIRAQASPSLATPLWIVRLQPAITWATATRPADSDTSLLAATEDGCLHLIDAASGEPLAQPLRALPGVQLGGQADAGDQLCCFDRHTIYTLHTSRPARLLWRFGQAPPAAATFDDDPERLTGWVAAQPTAAGVLALSSDGHLLVLASDNGRIRRQFDLGPLAVARLYADERSAAVLSHQGGKTSVTFVDLRLPPAATQTRELDAAWPLFGALLEEGLLTVDTQCVAVWPPDGLPRRHTLPLAAVRAAGLAVQSGTSTGLSRTTRKLLLSNGRHITALDPCSGRRYWSIDTGVDSAPVRAMFTPQGLCLVQYECQYQWGVIVVAAETGLRLADHFCSDGSEVIAVHAVRGRLCILSAPPGSADTPAELVVLPLGANTLAPAGTPGTRLRLARPQRLRACLWTEERVVLVEAHELRAYALPALP